MAKISSHRKGQSAIEYLTTYGWMLLVIAIVGGAIFTTIQSQSSSPSAISGFSGSSDLRIENFGVSDNGLQMEIRASTTETVDIVNVSVENTNTGDMLWNDTSGLPSIPSTDTGTVILPNITSGDRKELDLTVTYNEGQLTGLQETGTISGEMKIQTPMN
ncbi:MAG: hypothetical protein ABEJ95_00795 [Candidatus Nanohalobium sp.]